MDYDNFIEKYIKMICHLKTDEITFANALSAYIRQEIDFHELLEICSHLKNEK